ncbi:cytochrome c [Pedobacter sp. KR3-3]|uniref:Cytochrome c n=1 Tax=Pedobacter albus TaxID=3113905 RepID=A0ABU7I3V6_9SPHI|nr:cytochrome c [Pedobacter sp. KR3-3]MEE1944006.1 cytochrome c [Pedobacter sp. KR3-3]
MRKTVLFTVFWLTVAAIIYSCQDASEIEKAKYMSNGKDLYKTYCQNCHGENGEGLGELAPPLTDTVFLKDNKAKLACIIKNGTSEPITINGKAYQGKMPDFPNLHDIDVAQVMVYITNSFGNNQGMYDYQKVTADLQNCK